MIGFEPTGEPEADLTHTFEHREYDDSYVIALSGKFAVEAADELLQLVETLKPEVGVVLDLSDVKYISSSAIGCIARLAVDRGLVVANPSPFVGQALELAELSNLVRISSTVEEGRSLASRRREGEIAICKERGPNKDGEGTP